MVGILQTVYQNLYNEFGPQAWWPGDSPLEILIGAVLTQNTSWRNVERALENLRAAGLMDAERLREVSRDELAEWIRPAGYYRLKAARLKNVIDFIYDQYGGSLEDMFQTPLDELRAALLSINGIGPETADSILLYAGQLPTFVVDAYTARIGVRHGWLSVDDDYQAIKDVFESQLPRDVRLYNEFHALIVRVGKEYCLKRAPNCDACPLNSMLPASGPYRPELEG